MNIKISSAKLSLMAKEIVTNIRNNILYPTVPVHKAVSVEDDWSDQQELLHYIRAEQ